MSKTPEMDRAAYQVLRWVKTGQLPDADVGNQWRRSFNDDLHSILQGGSANHWLHWSVPAMVRGDQYAAEEIHNRLGYELTRGIGITEGMGSPTYAPLHIGWWSTVYYAASALLGSAPMGPVHRENLHHIARLSGALLDRICAVEVLMMYGHPVHGWESRLPGARADAGSVQHPRRLAGAMIGELLDRSQPWHRQGPDEDQPPAVNLLRAMRAAGVRAPAAGSGMADIVGDKSRVGSHRYGVLETEATLRRAVLAEPIEWSLWPGNTCMAWQRRGTHPQDPALMAVLSAGYQYFYLWPFAGEDPPEGGWSSSASFLPATPGRISADWLRRGDHYASSSLKVPAGSPLLTLSIGKASLDPLSDLPAPMRLEGPTHPARPTDPVDPWAGLTRAEVLATRNGLIAIRNHARSRAKRLVGHRALLMLDRAGAWDKLRKGRSG